MKDKLELVIPEMPEGIDNTPITFDELSKKKKGILLKELPKSWDPLCNLGVIGVRYVVGKLRDDLDDFYYIDCDLNSNLIEFIENNKDNYSDSPLPREYSELVVKDVLAGYYHKMPNEVKEKCFTENYDNYGEDYEVVDCFSESEARRRSEGLFKVALIHLEMIINPAPGGEVSIRKNKSDLANWLLDIFEICKKEGVDILEIYFRIYPKENSDYPEVRKMIEKLWKSVEKDLIKNHSYPRTYKLDSERLGDTMHKLLYIVRQEAGGYSRSMKGAKITKDQILTIINNLENERF